MDSDVLKIITMVSRIVALTLGFGILNMPKAFASLGYALGWVSVISIILLTFCSLCFIFYSSQATSYRIDSSLSYKNSEKSISMKLEIIVMIVFACSCLGTAFYFVGTIADYSALILMQLTGVSFISQNTLRLLFLLATSLLVTFMCSYKHETSSKWISFDNVLVAILFVVLIVIFFSYGRFPLSQLNSVGQNPWKMIDGLLIIIFGMHCQFDVTSVFQQTCMMG